MIHITDRQTDKILDTIPLGEFWDDNHHKSLKDTIEMFDFKTFGNKRYSEYLTKMNRIIIPDEDGTYIEFIIDTPIKYRSNDSLTVEVYTSASYLQLKKAKVIKPQKITGTASQHLGFALNGTEFRPGIVESNKTRTIDIERHTNPYAFIKRIANELNLEPRFRIETDGNKVIGRFVDLLERVGQWQGREVEFGKDLLGIERKEDFSNIVTALIGLGPEREDGTRLEIFVEDEEALQRWGRRNPQTGELMHLIEVYEPESYDLDMTESRLIELTENELEKRVNAIVEYKTDIADLEKVPGMENKKIRFGDTIRIKDTGFNPPLYIEARVHTQDRSLSQPEKKKVVLGDYIEYTEEEVHAIWKSLQSQIRKRLEKLVLVNIVSSAGNVFKNGVGSTQLTAKTFLSGAEVDEDGTKYEYRWHKFDKDGNYDAGFYEEGKTITISADSIDEKASFRVEIILDDEVLTVHEVTLTNVFDGEDGEQGPKGEDGKTFYTWIKYADTPTSGMSDSPEGKEYIGIAHNKETPTPSTNYADYVWSKFKGEQGVPGPPGEDGQPTYTWVKYADDEHGNGMSDSPEGKLYIGLAFNKTTPEESNNPADYTWSLMPQNIEIGGRNYISQSNLIYNRYINHNDGNELPANGHTATGFIEVVPNTDYTFSTAMPNFVNPRVVFYDENQTYIDGIIKISSSIRFLTFTTPSNAKYVRVSAGGGLDRADTFQLEKGNKATDWTRAEEDVQAEIDEAKQEAEEAKQEAQNAMQTADGKNTVFRQSSTPPTTNRKIGDLWFKTDEGNKMYVWTGSWTETKLDYQALSVGKLSAISADLGDITAGNITGVNISGVNIRGSNFEAKDPNQEDNPSGISISYDYFNRTYNDGHSTFSELYIRDSIGMERYDYSGVYGPTARLVGEFHLNYDSLLLSRFDSSIYDWVKAQYKTDGIEYNPPIIASPFVFDIPKAEFTGEVKINDFDNTLWSGSIYLLDTHVIQPSKALSKCMTGWILQWQYFLPGTGVQDHDYQFTYIPKATLKNSGNGHRVLLQSGSRFVTKYFYVYDNQITGHADNGQGDNRYLVLSAIYEF